MDEAAIKTLIRARLRGRRTGRGPSRGLYANAADLDSPQAGERIRGKANILAFRSAYPAQVHRARRTVGSGAAGTEGMISDDGDPHALASTGVR